jgi:putative component of toxin-antitoxin plasmid stabilization module
MLHYNKTYEITQTPVFNKWYTKQDAGIKIIIDARFDRLKEFGGNKNDQKRDIQKARKLQKAYQI